MSDELDRIETKLKHLEHDIVEEYRALREAAAEESARTIRFSAEGLARFREMLTGLKSALFGTADTKNLRLVCDRHDGLRIRMLYIEHLLDRDIPHPYLMQALQDFVEPEAPRPQRKSRPGTGPATAEGRQRQPGFLERLLSFLLHLVRGENTGRDRQDAAVGEPAAPTDTAPAATRAPVGNDLRLIYLHKLMEEDRLNLLPEGRRPPPVADGIKLPDHIARFSARDFAENHFAVRHKSERIARTPEELRAKLAQRQSAQTK